MISIIKKSKFLLLFILNISLYANEQNFEKYDGVAVILDLESSKEILFGNRVDERLNLCSTFKILNSLISLETKVVKDEFEISYTPSYSA